MFCLDSLFMAITYNLKYKKINYLGRPVLEKEGEIVIENDSFRLKGKGGNDKGELITFSDLKDIFVKNEIVTLVTLAKEKYYLTHFKNLMHDFVSDFFRMRNKFLLGALYLENGEFDSEYEANFDYQSKFGRTICKGKGRLRLYENCLVVIPEDREAFSVPFDLMAKQDVDEINYEVSVVMECGKKVVISQLHSAYDDFLEAMDRLRERMYQRIVDGFREHLPEFDATTVLKLGSMMRGGKSTSIKAIKKIDDELWEKFSELVLPTPEAKESLDYFLAEAGEENIYVGFHPRQNAPDDELGYYYWLIIALPARNIVLIEMTSAKQLNTHFFQIIMEQGVATEKYEERILELDQTMLTFGFNTDVFSRDRRDLKKTEYRLALAKVPFLRSLRKSYLGRAYFKTKKDWLKYVELMLDKATKRSGGGKKRNGLKKRG